MPGAQDPYHHPRGRGFRQPHSHSGEDLLLLPTLLRAAAITGSSTFLEMGALDGITGSNTLLLERCFNWTGVLVEGHPTNYQRLVKARRPHAAKVHAAACPSPGGHINMSVSAGPTAGQAGVIPSSLVKAFNTRMDTVVAVPCRPLSDILNSVSMSSGATFFSLECAAALVRLAYCCCGCAPPTSYITPAPMRSPLARRLCSVEGAEAEVLKTIDPSLFAVVMVESDGRNPAKEAEVDRLLTSAGLHRAPPDLHVPESRLYLRAGIESRPLSPSLLRKHPRADNYGPAPLLSAPVLAERLDAGARLPSSRRS